MKKQGNVDPARRGIGRFRAHLHPGALAEIESWREHPELGKLTKRLDSMADPNRFLDTYAECMVARRLLRHRCELRVEVQIQSGKRADFEATRKDVSFYLHLKRLNLDDPTRRLFWIANSAEALERINRKVKFEAHILGPEATNQQIQEFPRQLKHFGQSQPIGAQLLLPDACHPVLRVEILPEGRSRYPKLDRSFPRYPGSWLHDSDRFRKLLSKGYKQFNPFCFNLIAVTGYWAADWEDFERELRAFWQNGKHPASQAAAFFRLRQLDDDESKSLLWLRDAGSVDRQTAQLIREVFDDKPRSRAACGRPGSSNE
ncbi:MAG: hypothetical protein JXQ75_03815 [Phycisphaerae bacterium]|nr:hypothetical protein [Phycisphaerae bacterium]